MRETEPLDRWFRSWFLAFWCSAIGHTAREPCTRPEGSRLADEANQVNDSHYRGPFVSKSDGPVDRSSLKSPNTDRSRTYCRSMRIHSTKVTVLRPFTCQMHVRPGRTNNLWRCHGRHCRDSRVGSGRGPTSDISPTSTFQSCGN